MKPNGSPLSSQRRRHQLALILSATFFCASWAEVTQALPLEGRLVGSILPRALGTSPSVSMALGAEAEAGFRGSPWSIGTVARMETFWSELTPFTFLGSPNFSTWIRYTTARADNLSFSLFVGASQQVSGPLVSPIPEDPARNAPHSNVLLPVVGVTYRQQWGWFWTRVSPNAVLGLDPSYYTTYLGWAYPILTASGIPWLECGMSVLPGLSLSAALSTNLLRATWEF